MERVAVIMSTYNGQEYIREQIDSILAQERVDVILIIRDDGSSDSTLPIIEEYCKRYSNVILQNRKCQNKLGVKESFFSLLEWSISQFPEIQYFSFSDQDDFWEKNKLFEAISTRGKNPKWLYFSNKTIVNKHLQFLFDENLTYYNDILEICWGSQAYGCTMVFSRKLADIILKSRKRVHNINLMHDSFVYRVAHVIDSDITFDDRSFIKYRQHDSNVIGIKKSKKTNNDWKGLMHKSPHFISDLLSQIRDNYFDDLSIEGKYYLDLVCSYRSNIMSRWKLIIDKNAMRRGVKLYCIWVGKLLLRRL